MKKANALRAPLGVVLCAAVLGLGLGCLEPHPGDYLLHAPAPATGRVPIPRPVPDPDYHPE